MTMVSKRKTFKNGLWPFFLFISDVHLGHSKTPTKLILRNLSRYAMPRTRETEKLDAIFINGDFFDQMLETTSDDNILIRAWVAQLIRYCKEHDIKLRILRGTRLHDWDQPYMFVEENENHQIGCDLKYISTVHIEHFEDWGINILYVPDEAHTTSAATWKEVQRLMDEKNLKQVQYACMHGAFPYQLPEMAEQSVLHDPVKYESIVEHYISIGHVHQFNPCSKIIPQGSFDRICHGDEGTKGHVRLENNEVIFVENPGAMRYLTLDVCGLDGDEIIDKVAIALKGHDDPARIRLRCNKGEIGAKMGRRLSDIYRFCEFDQPDIIKDTDKSAKKEVKAKRVSKLPSLTRENLMSEIHRELSEEYPEYLEPCRSIVEALL